jgi:hypothetical protein
LEIVVAQHAVVRQSHRKNGGSLGRGTELELPPGRRLTTQGEPVLQVVVLLDGHADVTVDDRPALTLCAGHAVGWPEVVTHSVAPATVTTTTTSHVLVLTCGECTALRNDGTPVDALTPLPLDTIDLRTTTPIQTERSHA